MKIKEKLSAGKIAFLTLLMLAHHESTWKILMLNYNKSKLKGVLGEFGAITYFILFSLSA